jgi:AraC-like DNA-binding protein
MKLGGFGMRSGSMLFPEDDWLSYLFLILIPSIYLYFKSLYLHYTYFRPKFLLHFIFPVVLSLATFVQGFYQFLESTSLSNLKYLAVFVYVIYYFVSISLFLYLHLCKKKKEALSSQKHTLLIRRWVMFFYLIIVMLFIRFLLLFYGNLTNIHQGVSHILVIAGNILWFIAFLKILVSPEILYGYPLLKMRISTYEREIPEQKIVNSIWVLEFPSISNVQDSKLKELVDEKVKIYLDDIENFTVSKNPFRSPKYTSADMAKALTMPISHLSYLFKYHSKIGFTDYKNRARINDAILLIKDSFLETHTLEALAQKVGFSSYNSFFVAFKKQTDYAPKEYLSKGKK